MNIKIFIFNMLFLIILIALIYIHIYLTYNNSIESFTTDVLLQLPTGTGTNDLTTPSVVVKGSQDGSISTDPAPNAIFLTTYSSYTAGSTIDSRGEVVPALTSGNYYISIGPINRPDSSKRIFCILDTNYFSGGWMLAMRAVRGSTRFNFNAVDYWLTNRTFNDTDNEKILVDTAITNSVGTNKYAISSIGNLIYDSTDSNLLDYKGEIFNVYPVDQCMIIFYKKTGETYTIGGDGNDIPNKKSWIWYQIAMNTDTTSKKSLLNIFRDFYTINNLSGLSGTNIGSKRNEIGREINSFSTIADRNANSKFMVKTGSSSLWSQTRYGTIKYGLNFDYTNSPEANIRWGFSSVLGNTYVSGGLGTSRFSCGEGDESIAFELYVR